MFWPLYLVLLSYVSKVNLEVPEHVVFFTRRVFCVLKVKTRVKEDRYWCHWSATGDNEINVSPDRFSV